MNFMVSSQWLICSFHMFFWRGYSINLFLNVSTMSSAVAFIPSSDFLRFASFLLSSVEFIVIGYWLFVI